MNPPAFPAARYLDLSQTAHAALFAEGEEVWQVLPKIGPYLRERLAQLAPGAGVHGKKLGQPYIGPDVYIGAGTVVEPGAVIKGPAWIGENCEIRTGAYIRENVLVGDGAVLGNSRTASSSTGARSPITPMSATRSSATRPISARG